jgi:hypothetical protein
MAASRTERRLAAILAADVVGYSRLVEQDEAATLAALEAFDLNLPAVEARRARDEASELKAQGLIRRAIELDPAFARAHVVLAATYRRQVQNEWAPRDEAMAGWLAAATRAVELTRTTAGAGSCRRCDMRPATSWPSPRARSCARRTWPRAMPRS